MNLLTRNHLFRLVAASIFLIPLVPMYITPALGAVVWIFYSLYIRKNEDAYHRFKRGLVDLRHPGFGLAFMFLVLVSLISILYSRDRLMTLAGTLIYVFAFLLFFVIKYEVNRPFHLTFLMNSYFASVLLVGLYHLGQFLYAEVVLNVPFDRVNTTSFVENANILGCYMLIAIFPALMLSVNKENPKKAKNYVLVAFISVVSMFMTGSRASLIGIFIGLAALALIYSVKFLYAIIPATVLMFMVPYSRTRLFEILSYEQNYSRVKIWLAAIFMARDNPVFGIGLNSFGHEYSRYVAMYPILDNPYDKNVVFHGHNALLTIQAELGIFGTVALLAFFFFMFVSIRRYTTSGAKWQTGKQFFSGFMVSMIVFIFLNLIDHFFLTPKIFFTVAVLMAIMHGDARHKGMYNF